MTRDGGGCSVDTSFIFHPTHGTRVSVFPTSLISYLLQQLHRVAPSWALPFPPPSLRPSFLLSLTLRRRLSIAPAARGNLCFSPSLPHSLPLFLFVSPIFPLLPLRHRSALSAHFSSSPSSLTLFCLSFYPSVLTACLEYFGNYSGRLRRRLCFLLFFRPVVYTPHPRLTLAPIPIRLSSSSWHQQTAQSACVKPLDEYS